ncbi:MAG TPA: nucleotidyltransferase [bacterium]|nr:nucleotidyltransferase [bacterium]HNT67357.1 nucleotidyltransferase [bacterium]
MNIPNDFKEFIELLNAEQVRYLIVGGYAVGFHSRPKFTNDMDIWIDHSSENAQKMIAVLQSFGFAGLDLSAEDFSDPDKVIQLGVAPIRIDLITGLGIDFDSAFQQRIEGRYFGVKANFVSREHLIELKKQAGRKKDLDDIDWIHTYSE